jgi:hypothetical protein
MWRIFYSPNSLSIYRIFWYTDKFKLRQSLIIYGFTSRSRIFHLYGVVNIVSERWRAINLGAQGLWAGRDRYHATTPVFLVSFEWPPHSVAYYGTLGYVENLFLHGFSRGRTVDKYLHSRIFHLHGNWLIWLIDYLLFYVPLNNFSLICRRHNYCWSAKFRPMLGAQGFWGGGIFIMPHLLWHTEGSLSCHTFCDTGRYLYHATPAVTRAGFSGLIRRTAPFSRLLRHS